MRNHLAIASVACVGVLALGGAASAQISKFLQQPLPTLIDDRTPRTQEPAPTPTPTSRFFTAAQLRCTLRKADEAWTVRLVFADPSGTMLPHATGIFEAEPNRQIPITNHRVEGGERRFTVKYQVKDREIEIDFAVKVDGGFSATHARVGGEARQLGLEGTCEVASGETAEPRRDVPKPPTTVLNARVLMCTLNYKGADRKIEIAFYGKDHTFRPYFRELTNGQGFEGEAVNDFKYSDSRSFRLVFKNGLEVNYELAADGRLTAKRARQNGRDGQIDLHGSCQVNS